MSIEPASTEIDFVPIITAPLQPPTTETFKGRLAEKPYDPPEVSIDDEPETIREHKGGRPKSASHTGPRVMVMNLFTKDFFEIGRGSMTRGQFLDITEGFDPKYWQIQVWKSVRIGAYEKLAWAGIDG